MARSRTTASIQMRKLLRDRRKANRGDELAASRFKSTVDKMTIRANKMLDRLEAHGFTRQAYETAMNYIKPAFGKDATRFSLDLTNSRAMYQQAMAINHFLTLKSSTLSGSYEIQRNRIAAFRAKMSDSEYSGVVKTMKNKDILKFFDFLHDHPIGQFLSESARYQSGDEMDTFMQAMFKYDRSTEEIDKALAAYQRTETWDLTHTYPMPENEKFNMDQLLNYLKGRYDITWDNWKYEVTKRDENT